MSLSSVTVFTVPVEMRNGEYALKYRQVSGISHCGRYLGRIVTSRHTEQQLDLPGGMGERLFKAYQLAEIELVSPARSQEYKLINCHFFSSYLAGIEPSLHAPFTAAEGEQFEGNLPLGEIGIVSGADDDEPYHSFVGLGEEVPESIQEMWGKGVIGICNNEDLLSHLRETPAGQVKDINLYRQAQTSS